GDPVLDTVATPEGDKPGPYRGLSMNCASCHLSDELGARAFADFSRRSRQPDRGQLDPLNKAGQTFTTRNTMALRGALAPGGPEPLLHFDGEHASIAE